MSPYEPKNDFSIKIPIIAYHHVLPNDAKVNKCVTNSPFTLSEEQFYMQMLFLSQNGYHTINLDQLLNIINGSDNGGEQVRYDKMIVLTFDDGWLDNFEFAFPILKSFGFFATFFIITSQVNSAQYMSWEQLTEMQNHHMQIESHTHSHIPLELLSTSEIQWELTQSKKTLKTHLGKQVKFMSFPHGIYNKAVLDVARTSQYIGCCTSDIGHVNQFSKRYELPRILIRKNHSLAHFAKFCMRDTTFMLKCKLIQKWKKIIKDSVGLNAYLYLHSKFYGTKRVTV